MKLVRVVLLLAIIAVGGVVAQNETEAPTSEAPTSVAPTTDAPTSVAPTTDAPTSVAPTSVAPTTDAPTSVAPTTDAPTAGPTTAGPTSAGPTSSFSPPPSSGTPHPPTGTPHPPTGTPHPPMGTTYPPNTGTMHPTPPRTSFKPTDIVIKTEIPVTACFTKLAAVRTAVDAVFTSYGACCVVAIGTNYTDGLTVETVRKIDICTDQFSVACDKIDGFKFCTGTLNGFSPKVSFGLCVPEVCTVDDAKTIVSVHYREAMEALAQQLDLGRVVTFVCAAGPKLFVSIVSLALAFLAIKL